MPPASGHWLNNPHADDLDYQIEADYSGLMSPGMPNAASEISDKIGHIMNYGDGWYGGVYVGAMYSLAFISDDIGFIVTEALKTIPEQSRYYQCMQDVIRWHGNVPGSSVRRSRARISVARTEFSFRSISMRSLIALIS